MGILTRTIYQNPVWEWLLAVGVLLVVGAVLRVAMRLLVARLRRLVDRTPTQFDNLIVELLEKTRLLFILVVALYAGSLVLSLPDAAEGALRTLLVLALLFQAGYWGNAVVSFWIAQTVKRRLAEDAAAATSMSAVGFIAKMAIWTVVALLALDNLGIDITALIAGLGIGGIAIALAVQNILGDLFASLSILVDKPFVIGDFIIVGEQLGTVERIGLKTTRIRSLSGEQIVFSNTDLLSSRIRNYKRMYERRVVFAVGVTYQTPPGIVERIPAMIRSIVEETPNVRFDRSHFKEFGPSSLVFETVFYVLVPDYNAYMDAQQSINLGIMRAFQAEAIEFAYPTQTLFVQRLSPSEDE